MPLPVSSLSEACVSIRKFLENEMTEVDNLTFFHIGIPADAANLDIEGKTTIINLFFYRFDTSGFEAALRPDEIWRIRMYCLITPFNKDEDKKGSAGEKELRLLGNIMRVFHEHRVHQIDIDGLTAHLQVIFLPLSDEQLNQVWSTQGETTYRPSVVYEMSLTPIVPSTVWGGAPIVGALGTQLHADMSAQYTEFSGIPAAPPVVKSMVNIADPAWAPKICFIYQNQCVQSLSLEIDSSEFRGFTAQVWVAGDPKASVNLVWEVWKNGWTQTGSLIPVTPHSSYLDPEKIPQPVPLTLELPSALTLTADEFSAQALLYATRSVSGQDVKSNPLLISIYRKRV